MNLAPLVRPSDQTYTCDVGKEGSGPCLMYPFLLLRNLHTGSVRILASVRLGFTYYQNFSPCQGNMGLTWCYVETSIKSHDSVDIPGSRILKKHAVQLSGLFSLHS